MIIVLAKIVSSGAQRNCGAAKKIWECETRTERNTYIYLSTNTYIGREKQSMFGIWKPIRYVQSICIYCTVQYSMYIY